MFEMLYYDSDVYRKVRFLIEDNTIRGRHSELQSTKDQISFFDEEVISSCPKNLDCKVSSMK